MDARLLSANEAIARGAWEAGVRLGAGYPGTPSTEILEALSRYDNVYCEWSPNEKVALEVAVGATLAGARAIATMKHVGVNVAADPLFSAAYMGVNGGLVVVSADDPGMHSSQNEQDNRLIAAAARIPLLEPSTPQEAHAFARRAFDLSEAFDTPVMLRTTTRLAHGRGLVVQQEPAAIAPRTYAKNRQKNVLLPAYARVRHRDLEERRLPALAEEAAKWAEVIDGEGELAFITAGMPFVYVREAFPASPILKLGMTHPLPEPLIREFARGRTVVVIEELEPFLEHQIRAFGIDCAPRRWPRYGELSVTALKNALSDAKPAAQPQRKPLPVRAPALCPGCSHRGVFQALTRLDAIVSGDIGCYTLGALPPLDAMDSCLNMGASIGMAHGFSKVTGETDRPVVAVIGDSTFFHSGLTALLDLVHNGGTTTTIVLDNRTTAMTGHQGHPGTGERLSGEKAAPIHIGTVARALGIPDVRGFDAYDLDSAYECISDAVRTPGPSLLIARGPCVLRERKRFRPPVTVDLSKCTDCHACTRLGCPAIEIRDDRLHIDQTLCIGCAMCQRVCSNCQTGLDVSLMVSLVEQERMDEAVGLVLRMNPLPAITSRVCSHPCDQSVNAMGFSKPQARAACATERLVGDYALEHPPAPFNAPAREGNVCIVGSGPAGLSAAWQLRRRGWGVTVYEADDEPGGMLRTGIPEFRLPREIVNGEIDRMRAAGVMFKCNVRIGSDVSLDALRSTYDAVIIAVGAARAVAPHVVDADSPVALEGLEFLRQYNRGAAPAIGKRVAVIGGGNTAMDCARAALRLGAQVEVVYRRTEQRMPAIREEIQHARAEGVSFRFEHVPVRIVPATGQSPTQLEVQRAREESGRVAGIEGTDTRLPFDTVIFATGEEPDLVFLAGSGVQHNGWIQTNFAGVTNQPGVFACGDAAFGYGSVGQAIASGRKTAEAVCLYLDAQVK